MIATVVIFPDAEPRHELTLLLTVITLVFYSLVLILAGFGNRLVQTLTAVFGVDALFTAMYVIAFTVVGLVAEKQTAMVITWMISYWLVPVQGHIISRAIEQHWFVGIGFALALHIMMLLVYQQLSNQV